MLLEHSGSAGLLPMNSIRVQWGQPLEIYSKYKYKQKYKYQVQVQAIFAHILASMIAIGTQGRCLKLEPSAIMISHNFMHYWHTAQPWYSHLWNGKQNMNFGFWIGCKMCKVTLNSEHVQWHWCDGDAPPEFYYEASLASLCAKLLLSHHYFVGTTITLPQLLAPFVCN